MKRSFFPLCMLLLIMTAFPVNARGEKLAEFYPYELEVPGEIEEKLIFDLNQDGLKDLIILHTGGKKEEQRFLSIFLQEKRNGFSRRPFQTLEIKEGFSVFDVGDIIPNPGAEIVLLDSSGVSFYQQDSSRHYGKLTRLFESQNILANSGDTEVRSLKFLWDLNGDGSSEILIPTLSGYQIYRKGNDGVFYPSQLIRLDVPVTSDLGPEQGFGKKVDINRLIKIRPYLTGITVSYQIPSLFVEDFNGDDRKDLVGLCNNELSIFLQRPDGSIPEHPDRKIKRSLLTEKEKKLAFAGESMVFADLNGDKIMDLIVSKYGAKGDRGSINRYLYFGQNDLHFNEYPDQILFSENIEPQFGIIDLNNDGKLDLVIPFFKARITQALKVIVQNKIKILFSFYLLGEDGKYPQQRSSFKVIDYQIKVFDINLFGKEFRPLISTLGDFNGDGYPDLASDNGQDHILIFRGSEKGEFGRQPDQIIKSPSTFSYDIDDLNGNGRSDIILYYSDSKQETSMLRVLLTEPSS
ncbi:MAG: VCBS repeat-containing protein [Deltaproteobacteria bacterium]|nr:MAG: VCBS repeat-containing protein [Deltaproteobacteria bacterium]